MSNSTLHRDVGGFPRSAAIIGAVLIFSTPALADERDAERASVSEILHLQHARHDQAN